MLIEDFNKESIIVDYIINECKRLKCMESLKDFINGNSLSCTMNHADSHGTHKVKKAVKSKSLPLLLFKETDTKLKELGFPLLSRSHVAQRGGQNDCIVFIPDNSSVSYLGQYEQLLGKKNKELIARLTKHLNSKSDMDEFDVGECISNIDIFSKNSLTNTTKNFSEAYSNIVKQYPNNHKLMAKYYFKPLKQWMDDYLTNCPNGSTELFDEHDECHVSCSEIPYISLSHIELSENELINKFKKRMNGYV